MNADMGINGLFYLLLLILPIAALLSRRVPLLRLIGQLAIWAAIFGLGLLLLGQRERFDPYLQRAATWLKLDDQSVVGKEVRIRMAADGHFWAKVTIGGVQRRMLIDSGATVTAVSTDTAADAGLKVSEPAFPMMLRTANGTISAQVATVDELGLGDIVARKLSVVVSPAFGDTDVLGMNFLSRLKSWRVEGSTLILTPHHPRSFT
ncbi:TIGR02281 family clan AA aspartic protease [Sphingomonas bacterium]|uniref:TIGR02281 family clan AA aspartic protease n=1 Tax=Sphingomonas bacterium TaxID=1895847 RepID=UPI0034A05837